MGFILKVCAGSHFCRSSWFNACVRVRKWTQPVKGSHIFLQAFSMKVRKHCIQLNKDSETTYLCGFLLLPDIIVQGKAY